MGFRPFVGSVNLNRFDPSWVRPRSGLEFWPLLGPYMSWTWVLILGLSTLGIFKFFILTGSVHFVSYGLDLWWVRPLYGLVLTLGGVRPLCGFLWKFVTLVGSVHFVDYGLDPWWSPSTLWIYIILWPWLGPSTSWTEVLTLGGVRPLCGFA